MKIHTKGYVIVLWDRMNKRQLIYQCGRRGNKALLRDLAADDITFSEDPESVKETLRALETCGAFLVASAPMSGILLESVVTPFEARSN